jgi:hypothetical protein
VETYAVIGAAAVALWLIEEATQLTWVMIVPAIVASLVVLALTHRSLRIDDIFPEVDRWRATLVRRFAP